MNPVNSYWGMLDMLEHAFRTRYKPRDVNITGILFARPASPFAQQEILPHVDYWHHRSDNYTDFFCPGFLRDDSGQAGPVVTSVGGAKWCFSNEQLVTFLSELEPHTSWRYSGGCELVVTNARYDRPNRKVRLDLSSAMAIDLEAAQKDEAVRNVTGLCEAIFAFTKNLNDATDDPCWEFSDTQGQRIVKGSLKEFLFNYLPSWIKPEARKALHFVAANLQPRA